MHFLKEMQKETIKKNTKEGKNVFGRICWVATLFKRRVELQSILRCGLRGCLAGEEGVVMVW